MVGVVGLNEAIVRESVVLAGGEKVRKCAEERWLVLEQVYDLD